MLLVYGIGGVTLARLFYGVTLIGGRNPRAPGWANDFLVANVYVPSIIALAVVGVGSTAKYIVSIGSTPPGLKEPLLAAAIGIGGLLLFKSLRIKQRLAGFEASRASATPLPLERFAAEKGGLHDPGTPIDPTSGNLAA
ncbi:MAG TPA: hypothetical protein VLT88_05195 [Desulfosarcina sp.]|nr:hypothetical protein [Desulfosarcina sp.]